MNPRQDGHVELEGKPIVLVGAGRMGRTHAKALQSLGLAVNALCDTRPEVLAGVADDLAVPAERRFGRLDRLLDRIGPVGLVIVATTADSHCELVCRSAEAGASLILCEKPMATSVADCDRILATCEASGTRLAVNHQMRFMPQYTMVKDELRTGRFGELASMNVVAGCFGVAMNASHYVEAFRFLTESRPRSVTAWFSPQQLPNPRGAQFVDQAGQLCVLSEDGQRLYLEIGGDQGHGMTVTYATSWGHVFVDELAGEYIATARKAEHRGEPMTRYGMPWDRWQRAFPPAENVGPTAAVQKALIGGDDYPDGVAGRSTVAVLAAAYRSAETRSRDVDVEDLAEYAARRFPWA